MLRERVHCCLHIISMVQDHSILDIDLTPTRYMKNKFSLLNWGDIDTFQIRLKLLALFGDVY